MTEISQPDSVQTTPIYDISGNEPVLGDIPHDQVQQAVASGKYSLPKGQDVSVVSPDGTFGTVPPDKAADAFNSGYQYATPTMLLHQDDVEKYGTTAGQQIIAGAESGLESVLGPGGPLLERAFGVDPEAIQKRAELNPITHNVVGALGFGASALMGVGEAGLLGKIGDAAGIGTRLALSSEVVPSIATRLAAGAVKSGAEMAAYQAGDELSKYILDVPNTPGQAAANIGLSSLIGGVMGGSLSALGMGATGIINSQGLKEFSDRLALRSSGVDPNAALEAEVQNAVKTVHNMYSEVGGANGLTSQVLEKIMPKMSDNIAQQVPSTISSLEKIATDMEARPFKYGTRIPGLIREGIDDFKTATEGTQDPGVIFDALNTLKREFDSNIPKNLGPHLDNFQALKLLSSATGDIRQGLMNPEIWGDGVANFQKEINSAWHDVITPVKQIEKKFFSDVGNESVINSKSFSGYMNENGKVTSPSIRQQIMGKFADAVEKFSNVTDGAYQKIGAENPFEPIGLSAIRESMGKPSVMSQLADAWHDKIAGSALGNALGGLGGAALGHATGVPGAGLGGSYLGKWVLGPIFGAIIKPLMDKGVNLPATKAALAYAKSVLSGNDALMNGVANIFKSGAMTIPSHLLPNSDQLDELDKRLKDFKTNPLLLMNSGSTLGKMMPSHAQALAQTAAVASNYLNGMRPVEQKNSPLDSPIPISKAQKYSFNRNLSIAQQPLAILDHIKNGTLLPQDIQTLKTIYPSYYSKMSQEVMNAMTDHLSKGGSMSSQLKQSVSQFVGQPLDSTLTQSSMASILMANAPKSPMTQMGKPKKTSQSTTRATDKLASLYQTPGQARQAGRLEG